MIHVNHFFAYVYDIAHTHIKPGFFLGLAYGGSVQHFAVLPFSAGEAPKRFVLDHEHAILFRIVKKHIHNIDMGQVHYRFHS